MVCGISWGKMLSKFFFPQTYEIYLHKALIRKAFSSIYWTRHMIFSKQSARVAKSCDNWQKKGNLRTEHCLASSDLRLTLSFSVCTIKSASTQLCLRSIFLLDSRVSHKWAAPCNFPSNQLCNLRANADISWKQIIRQCRFPPSFPKRSIQRDLVFFKRPILISVKANTVYGKQKSVVIFRPSGIFQNFMHLSTKNILTLLSKRHC